MIYDKETAFIFNKDVTTTPNVVANGNGGNAYGELFLSAKFAAALTTAAVVTLKTADAADVSKGDTLCTLTVPVGASHGSIRVPFGGKKYYGITVTGPTSGKCTIALTLDAELE